MQRSSSDTQLLQTRRHLVRDHIGGAIPGYQGHVPGSRTEDSTVGHIFAVTRDVGRHARSRSTFDAQAHRKGKEDEEMRTRSLPAPTRAPAYDNRGNGYLAAGDTRHSRIAGSAEEKDNHHFHSSMGLTSHAHEDRGGAGQMKGYGSAARCIPGYTGNIPGRHSENCFAEGWSKSNARSLSSHFEARIAAPKKLSLLTEGRTLVAPLSSDTIAEVPLRNPSYHDRVLGWSACEFTGTHIDPAGRLGPKDRQEAFGGVIPKPMKAKTMQGNAIHGYAGWVPGRVGESVIGERQCKTNAVADQLFQKSRMRITQR